MTTDDSPEEGLSELDKIIKKEAQINDRHNKVPPKEIIEEEANENDKHYTPIDEKILEEEAEETNMLYSKDLAYFAETYADADSKIEQKYFEIFGETLAEKQETVKLTNELVMNILGKTSETETLETKVKDYAIRDALGFNPLNDKEKTEYYKARAILKLTEAYTNKEAKKELMQEAKEIMSEIPNAAVAKELSENVRRILRVATQTADEMYE